MEQRRFADAVAADEADPRAGHDLHRAVVDQQPSGNADRNIGDGKHAALSPDPPANATDLSVKTERMSSSVQLVIAASQLVDQLAQTRRQFGFGTHVLLQPFADGFADRYAGLVIDLFDIAV